MKQRFLSFCFLVFLHFNCQAQRYDFCIPLTEDSSVIEKVYLQTDRDFYSQGDNIWFKAWLAEDPDLYLSSNSMNLHVDLISDKAEITDSRIIKMEQGLGKGDFILSDTIKPGPYTIRAYTNYMRNFTDMQVFEKVLFIFSSSKQEGSIEDTPLKPESVYDIRFFPEGGSLVNNIICKVAFKASDEIGKGCDVSGKVYSSAGEYVTSFSTSHKGMGRFFIRPADGISYYTIVKTPDAKEIRRDLPKSFKHGITLNVSDYQNKSALITIRANQATLDSITDQVHFITVYAHKREFCTLGFSINSLSTSFRLSLDELPTGIIHLILNNSDGVPLCERLIFHENTKIKLNVITDKTVYDKRSRVEVKLSLTGDSIGNENAFVALSAAETAFLSSDYKVNSSISSWFLMESDIRGIIEDPATYFDSRNPGMIDNLDLLLCTHGWRDFKWKYEEPVFRPEYGITISGEVRKSPEDSPLPSAVVNAILRKDKNQLMMTSFTDSSGRFYLEEMDFAGSARLIATALSNYNAEGHLVIDTAIYRSLSIEQKRSRSGLLSLKDIIPAEQRLQVENEFITRRDSSRKMILSDTILLGEVTIVGRKKRESSGNSLIQSAYVIQKVAVGIPDVVVKINPGDERYNNFRDIIRRGVSGVKVEVTNDVTKSGIAIRGSSLEPLFMLDGISVPYSMIEYFPVKWIDRIEIMKSGGLLTSFTQITNPGSDSEPKYNGVISIISKPEENRNEKKVSYNSINRIVKGFDAPRIFYSPDYSVLTEQTYQPDLRSTILWDPDINASSIKDCNLSFYNNDKHGYVRIVVEGITTSGIPVTGSVEYEVR